ncbi:uncharacterized protein [Physcomitrium patens]
MPDGSKCHPPWNSISLLCCSLWVYSKTYLHSPPSLVLLLPPSLFSAIPYGRREPSFSHTSTPVACPQPQPTHSSEDMAIREHFCGSIRAQVPRCTERRYCGNAKEASRRCFQSGSDSHHTLRFTSIHSDANRVLSVEKCVVGPHSCNTHPLLCLHV